MKTATVGTDALLPDGERVKIEIVHEDGYATVRRIDGDRAGQIAVCAIEKLELIERDSGMRTSGSHN